MTEIAKENKETWLKDLQTLVRAVYYGFVVYTLPIQMTLLHLR